MESAKVDSAAAKVAVDSVEKAVAKVAVDSAEAKVVVEME